MPFEKEPHQNLIFDLKSIKTERTLPQNAKLSCGSNDLLPRLSWAF
jgi:ATP-dependent RNA circularization protein (DNA/RNA ligase family)